MIAELFTGYEAQISASRHIVDVICCLIERINERRPFSDAEILDLNDTLPDFARTRALYPETDAMVAKLRAALLPGKG